MTAIIGPNLDVSNVAVGDDVNLSYTVVNSVGAPFPWAGYTLVGDIDDGSTDWTVDITVDGTLGLSLTAAQMTTLGAGLHRCDLRFTAPSASTLYGFILHITTPDRVKPTEVSSTTTAPTLMF